MPLIKELLILFIIYYWLALAVLAAEMVKIKTIPCTKGRELNVKSEVHEVLLGPCSSKGKCELLKGSSATLTVKFTPKQSLVDPRNCKLKSKLAWLSKMEMNFGGLSPHACDYMKCPLKPNKEMVFNATFFVPKMWPTGTYPMKLRIHENAGNKRVFLCQLFKIHLTGQPVIVDNMLT